MKKKIAGIILASVLTFSVMAGVQASAEDRLWENSMEADGVEDDISQNQTEMKDGDDSTSEDNEENTENEGIDLSESDTEAEEDPSEAKEETEISFEEEQENIDAEVEENPEQELELNAEMGEEDLFMDNEKSIATYAGSGIPVEWVGPNYKMRPEYAFTYAFRKGVTQLSYISRKNDSLNNKIHNWFGDNKGYTTEYCQSFYACAIGNTSNTDAITAIYSNVGEYQGQIVDLKVTVPAWGTVNNDHVGKDKTKITPCVLFYKDRIAFNTISVGTVRFQFEFLKHNTSVQIYPKGHITAVDLDSGQGIRTYDSWGVDHIYLRSGYDYLRTTEGTTANGNAFREIRGKADGGNITTDDVEGWCQLDFNGSFIINWLAQDSWKNSTGAQNAFYLSTGQTIGSYEPNPGPEKRVGDENASFDSMARHTFTDNDPAYETQIRKTFARFGASIVPYEFTEQWIQYFRRNGMKIYYLSNYSEELYRQSKERLLFLNQFDGGVFSWKEKCMKPDKDIYEILLSRYEIDPKHALFFDDRKENVEIAVKLGIRGVVFRPEIARQMLKDAGRD